MISGAQKYLRPLIGLGLITLFLASGLAMMAVDIAITATFLLLSALGIVIYFLVAFWLKRKNALVDLTTWKEQEPFWSVLLIGLLSLIGTIESFKHAETLSIACFMLSVAALVFGYMLFKNKLRNKSYTGKTIAVFRWSFGIGIGILLIAIEDKDYEPVFSIATFIYFVVTAYWVIRWLVGQVKSVINLKNELAKTELSHLQSQVNPHFFFNTLNNLYGMIDKDSKRAKSMVLKLSDMMRYSVYNGQKDWVTLEEELDYINNYIELHKARYHKKMDIKLHHHIQKEGIKVMPLLFIILLENAFKHGVENLREDAYIQLNLIAGEGEINFGIENNFDPDELTDDRGIGLNNLKRRLELAYPDKHSFTYSVHNNVFKAQLTLKTK